jgi:hypothetical protein
MTQALGLGGFPNFARHDYSWFEALGFRMGEMPASRYLGAGRLVATAMRVLRRDRPIPYPLGLERDGEPLFKPFCPPYYPSMEAAVRAFVDVKFGADGVYRGRVGLTSWRDAQAVAAGIPVPSEQAIAATIAYCEYIYGTYGRFPAYSPPLRTVVGYQVTHVDPEFYDRFFQPQALTETQRRHPERCPAYRRARPTPAGTAGGEP